MIGFGQGSIISKVANEGLKDYLEKIPLGQEEMFGFNNRHDFSKAEIGIPYEVFTLNADFFNDENIRRDKNYIISTGNWRVPIIVDNEYRALLTISNFNKTYGIVKIGAKGLAEELGLFKQNYTSINTPNILRVFQLKGDFILTSNRTIYPLTSASNGLLVDGKKVYSLYAILVLIKNKVIPNINGIINEGK